MTDRKSGLILLLHVFLNVTVSLLLLHQLVHNLNVLLRVQIHVLELRINLNELTLKNLQELGQSVNHLGNHLVLE